MDTPCYLLEGAKRKGYVRLQIGSSRRPGEHRLVSAHRVAWMAVNGPVPEGGQVLHHCDNRACIRADHLYLGNNDDNVRDRVMRMRSSRKLSDQEVLEIRSLYGRRGVGGLSGVELSRRYNVSRSEISRIITFDLRAKVGRPE